MKQWGWPAAAKLARPAPVAKRPANQGCGPTRRTVCHAARAAHCGGRWPIKGRRLGFEP
jgi:hypothetical protein